MTAPAEICFRRTWIL